MTPMCSLAGDLNMDDAVNATDLLAFVPGFGTADCGSGDHCTGDIDSDGDMDGTGSFYSVEDVWQQQLGVPIDRHTNRCMKAGNTSFQKRDAMV